MIHAIPWRRIGGFFLILKALVVALTVFHMVDAHAHGWSYALWLAGKIVPEIFCICFLVDALFTKAKRLTVAFWAVLVAIVPFYSLFFAIKQSAV